MGLRAAVIQMKSLPGEVDCNCEHAAQLLTEAAQQGAKLVVLPETWAYGFTEAMRRPAQYAARDSARLTAFLQRQARDKHIWLVGGSLLTGDADGVYNRVLLLDPRGNIVGGYCKQHLYPVGNEAAGITPGQQLPVFQLPLGQNKAFAASAAVEPPESQARLHLALATCFDVRFPELSRYYALQGAEVLAVPAVFTAAVSREFPWPKTRHWQVLLQARALENMFYVLAANGAGGTEDQACGHSLIIDPWGQISAEAGTEEQILTAEINLEFLRCCRRELPVLEAVRPDLLQKLAQCRTGSKD